MVKVGQKLPKWFKGEVYEIGDEVRNAFSDERCELTAEELSMYDFIMGMSIAFEAGYFPWHSEKFRKSMIEDFDKGKDWFRKTNPEAYMILLD